MLTLEAILSATRKLNIVIISEMFHIYMENFHAFHTCSVNNNAPGIKFVLAVVLKIDRKIIHYYINFFIYCVQVALNIEIYRYVILTFVLYGFETWFVILREEIMLRVCESRVMRRIFGPKRDEVTWERGKVHDEERNDLYS